MDVHAWPSVVQKVSWPKDGVTYTFEHRGYIRPEKLEYWLTTLFGPQRAKYMLFNQRLYVKSPRQPTPAEKEWMMDSDPASSVEVEGFGLITLPKKNG
ncbi:hypothetical protein PV05_05466 [Exophiala xenobiotica]|uniref:Uncharacterized protein n=1 Tax=Exophiala xenobiotica TaxID=348802 RepID=A0A0D2EQ45_9EURO|nr:uncharacterized protein PV05_05466 [Exophiala xenobiotica]KIW56845.1 hypothetical protein PV05_05466 [Exophiala xenobiotica]